MLQIKRVLWLLALRGAFDPDYFHHNPDTSPNSRN